MRLLRDGILRSKRVDQLSPLAELFYRRLMSVVDDYGRYSADTRELRAACFPLRIDTVKGKHIEEWLAECVKAGLVLVYQAKREKLLQLLDFGQRERGKSKYEAPPSTGGELPRVADDSPHVAADRRESQRKDAVVVVECEDVCEDEDGKAARRSAPRSAAAAPPPPGVAAETWAAWIRQKGKSQTAEADRLQRKHLAGWSTEGYDPNRIVEDAVAGNWRGLHKPRDPPRRTNGHETAKERGMRVMDEITGKGNGRGTIEGVARRVDQPPVPALPTDLREPARLDVGRDGTSGTDERVGH